MSHPWKAQPYYLYREPRTTGSVPAPLGFGNADYTRGSFTAKSPWNVPAYVASQPTGLNGFGATDAQGACESYAVVKTWIRKNVVDPAFAELPAKVTTVIGGLADPLATALTDEVKTASGSSQGIQSRVDEIAKNALKAVMPSDPLGVLNFVIDLGVPALRKYLVNVSRICAAPAAAAITDCTSAQSVIFSGSATAAQKEQARQLMFMWNCPALEAPSLLAPLDYRMQLQQRTASALPGMFDTTKIQTKAQAEDNCRRAGGVPRWVGGKLTCTPGGVAATRGITPVVIGAAAIAALLLLR